jgi:hypothetical protein
VGFVVNVSDIQVRVVAFSHNDFDMLSGFTATGLKGRHQGDKVPKKCYVQHLNYFTLPLYTAEMSTYNIIKTVRLAQTVKFRFVLYGNKQ